MEGVSETMLMTLLARARESQGSDPMLRDEKAVAMVNQIDHDFSRLHMQRHDEVAVIMRMRKFDAIVASFLRSNPGAVVVHIGCGLDTRFDRVDDERVEWFDLDLPEVMTLRRKLIPCEIPRYHALVGSVFEAGWLEQVLRFRARPFLFIAEGVFPYFTEEQVKSLFIIFNLYFPGCEIACDAHTPLVIWLDNLHLAFARVKARLQWSIKQGKDVESWAAGIRLLEAWDYFQDDESPLKAFRWMRFMPILARSSGIFHYQLGSPP